MTNEEELEQLRALVSDLKIEITDPQRYVSFRFSFNQYKGYLLSPALASRIVSQVLPHVA